MITLLKLRNSSMQSLGPPSLGQGTRQLIMLYVVLPSQAASQQPQSTEISVNNQSVTPPV